MCYKIEYIVLELPVLPAAEVASGCHVGQKSSSLNSVCKPRIRVLCTWFHLSPPVRHQMHSKNFLRQNTQFQNTQSLTLIPSHSRSLSHSLTLLSVSVFLLLSLSCSISVVVAVALSLSFPLAPLLSLSLPSFCLRLA